MPAWLNSSTFLTALAGAIAIYAAIRSSIESAQDTEERNRLLIRLDKDNQEIISAQQDALAHFTGGNSIFHFHFEEIAKRPYATYRIKGKYPVPNIQIGVLDIQKAEKLNADDPSGNKAIKEGITSREIAKAWPGNTTLYFRPFPFNPSGQGIYFITITQPTSNYLQVMRMTKLKDESHAYAYQVYRVANHEKTINIIAVPELHYCDSRIENKADFLIPVLNPGTVKPNYSVVEKP